MARTAEPEAATRRLMLALVLLTGFGAAGVVLARDLIPPALVDSDNNGGR